MSPFEVPTDTPGLQPGSERGAEAGLDPQAEVVESGGTTNVTMLHVAKHAPTPAVVSILEGMLESAKAGKYNAVMVVATDWEGCVTDAFALAVGTAKYSLIGGAYCMLQKFVEKHIE